MKLLHITATHLKPEGGVPVVLKELVTEQNKIKGFTAKVISLVAPVDSMDSEYFEYVNKISFEKYILCYRPDCAILHSFHYMEYNYVVTVLNRYGIRYYIEPHGSFGTAAMRKSWLKKRIANLTVFRKQISKAYGFIFLNEAEKNNSVYRTNNDVIIPNGIRSDSVYTGETNDNVNPNQVEFYYIGRYDINHKGLDYLFDALDLLDEGENKYVINLWGKGDDKSTEYINRRIGQYSHIVVKQNGPIYGDEKNKSLEQIGPMILTSRYEGFPMTILEAWSYGNPCIVTKGTNVKEEVEMNGLGWGVELEPRAIADGIICAAKEYSSNRKYYVKTCKAYVQQIYDWRVIAEQSYSLLDI